MLKIDADTFHRWNMRVAQLATPESRQDVPERLVEACKTLVPADAGVINIFGETVSPRGVYDDIPPGFKVHHVVSYLDGAYLLDPYYRAGVDGVPSGLYSLRDVAPSGFSQSEYYKSYYKKARIIDEVGFITHFPDGCFANLSFVMFEGSQRFRKSALDRLQLARPLVESVLKDYWENRDHEITGLHSQLEVALGMFGDSALTVREAEVVRLYLQGHSTRSIGERLGISTHTVSMHRKNAYAKLDVTSQYELFHMFIDSLTCFDPACPDDPLRRYLGKQGGRTDVGD